MYKNYIGSNQFFFIIKKSFQAYTTFFILIFIYTVPSYDDTTLIFKILN